MRLSLFNTLLLMMLGASVPAILLLGYLTASNSQRALTEGAHELARERVQRLNAEVRALMGESARPLVAQLRGADLAALPERAQAAALERILSSSTDATAIALFERKGEPLAGLEARAASTTEQEARAMREASRSAIAQQGEAPAVAVRFAPERRASAAIFFTPLPGAPERVAAVELTLARVQRLLEQQPLSGSTYLVDAAGRLIAHPDLERVRQREDFSAWTVVQRALSDPSAVSVAELDTPRGSVLSAWATLPPLGWRLISEQPTERVFAASRRLMQVVLVGALLAVLLAAGLAALSTRHFARPLHGFADTALQIAQGQFGVQMEVKGAHGELERLGQVFNYMSQQLLAYDNETRGLYKTLEEGYLETMVMIANAIDSKDSYTHGHSQRVAAWASDIGRELGLPEMEVRHLLYGGLLHDVGKIGIVEPILAKRSGLSDEEMGAMRAHPVLGATIIGSVKFLKPVLPAVRHHHERWDGKGYPDGLAGDHIPMIARIVAAADIWDACTSLRPYQQPMTTEQALELFRTKMRGVHLDPAVVDALDRVVQQRLVRGERVSAADRPTTPPHKVRAT